MLEKTINTIKLYLTRRNIEWALIFVGVLIGVYFQWGLVEVAIFAVFIYSLLHPISSRYFALGAIFFLAVTPFLLVLDRKDQAESFAVYAYYFLCLAVIMGLYEVRKHSQKNDQA